LTPSPRVHTLMVMLGTTTPIKLYIAGPQGEAVLIEQMGRILHAEARGRGWNVEVVSTWYARIRSEILKDHQLSALEKRERNTINVRELLAADVFVVFTDAALCRPNTTLCELGVALHAGLPVVWVQGSHRQGQNLMDGEERVWVVVQDGYDPILDAIGAAAAAGKKARW